MDREKAHLIYQRLAFQNGMHICCFQSQKLSFQPFRKCLCFTNTHDITAYHADSQNYMNMVAKEGNGLILIKFELDM